MAPLVTWSQALHRVLHFEENGCVPEVSLCSLTLLCFNLSLCRRISGTKWMNTSNAMPDDKRGDSSSEDFVTVVSDVKQLEVALLPILILPISPLGLSQSCDLVLKKTILLTTQYSKKVSGPREREHCLLPLTCFLKLCLGCGIPPKL